MSMCLCSIYDKYMKKLLPPLFVLLFLLPSSLKAQKAERLRIAFYNVENFFDLRHDTLKQDEEYLPGGIRGWNYRRYRDKANGIARTLLALGEGKLPMVVGLCEVENDSVLYMLTRYSLLQRAGYDFVMTQSPDVRGVDVGLLYQPRQFALIDYQSHRIAPPHPTDRPTRDLLHVSGQLLNHDTLDVVVAHLPSRMGGTKQTNPYRIRVAERIKQLTDSLMVCRRQANIIVMGDFNCSPNEAPITEILKAEAPPANTSSDRPNKPINEEKLIHPKRLYHLLAHRNPTTENRGSYKYQGRWELIDHIVVSGSMLLPSARLHTDRERCRVFNASFLLEEDKQYGGTKPWRTYQGMKYQGGMSDHLPVWVEIEMRY